MLERIAAFWKFIWANIRIVLWALAGIVVSVLTIWAVFLRKKNKLPDEKPVETPTNFQDVARQQINLLETEARIQAEVAKAKSADDREQLKVIQAVPDGAKRRKALANYLDANL